MRLCQRSLLAYHEMTVVLLLLPFLVSAISNLPPQPAQHLTPPQQYDPQKSLETLARRNDSSKGIEGSQIQEKKETLEPKPQEARAILWAAPAIPVLSSLRGRSSDCNPCDRVPWVPMGRALNTQQYALSIPTIQLTLPVNYGIPIAQLSPPSYNAPSQQYGPPPQQYGPPLQQYGHPPQQYGPPHSVQPTKQYVPQSQNSGPQPQQYGPPPINSGSPPQKTGPPNQHYGPPSHHYGPPGPSNIPPQPAPQYGPALNPPATSNPNNNDAPQNQYVSVEDEQEGLPPPPLPQRFLSPTKTYGPPQPQTQYASPTNINPTSFKYLPPPPPSPPLPNIQLLPSVKYGPPFNANIPLHASHPPSYSIPSNGARPIKQGLQQYQDESIKKPVLVGKPIPFPTMSKTQLPPLYDYQVFNDGKNAQVQPYLQPPNPQNVVFTISETDDICKKCQEKSKVTDSEPAQAEHVTENIVKTTAAHTDAPLDNKQPNVQVVKSVPLAEYLESVEYPMQIIQAPILDVPDLSKYFNLGYQRYPQVTESNTGLQDNGLKLNDQKQAQSNTEQSGLFVNQNSNASNLTSKDYTSSDAVDNVDISGRPTESPTDFPHNHKPNVVNLGKNHGMTEIEPTSSSKTTPFYSTATTRPSQIFHISKVRTTNKVPQLTTQFSTPQYDSTSKGHYVTSAPVTEHNKELQTPNKANPAHFHEPTHASSHTTAIDSSVSSSAPPSLRFNDLPVGPGAIRDWAMHTYGRGWGNTPPQPFVKPTVSPSRPRFENGPSTIPGKKAKHIHQIIVPYTKNEQLFPVAQVPSNYNGWTPLPPTNQGRKVPTGLHVDSFPSTTGFDQIHNYHNFFPTENSHNVLPFENIPMSSSGSDKISSQQLQPVRTGQPLNLPPQLINQFLHLNQQGPSWPSGPEDLQHVLSTNLQGLLRGEEDSVDFARLQKNIDNWTAEGYKQNSPSVNFIPVTTIPHIYNSKKIPDEYLTSTEPTISNSSKNEIKSEGDRDHEGAESQEHQIKVHPQVHSKDQDNPDDLTGNLENLLSGWSLLETKMTVPPATTSEKPTTEQSVTEAVPTSKVWEKIQVSISPLTNEKVYVVTPVPATESQGTLLSSRIERSYSVVSAGTDKESKMLDPLIKTSQ